MTPYKAPAFRHQYRPAPLASRRLGQEAPTGSQIKTAGVGLGLLSTTLSGAAAWVGLHTGIKESGILSIAGWVVGVTGAIMGAMSFFGTVGLLLTPAEELERAAREARPAAPPPPSRFEVSPSQSQVLQEVA